MPGFPDWLKKNTGDALSGTSGKIFAGFAVADILTADNKIKAVGKAILDIVLMKPLFAAFIAGSFGAMSKSIRSLVSDTGSLEAFLRKLTQIQGFQRVFAPLVGGAEAAKRKVAELVNFAAKSSFGFGDVGETARGLQILTRGTFASASALKTVGDAAAATGNGLVQTGDAVGEFYATLRAGAPIDAATEKLRQMGLINDSTAESLKSLQQSGAGTSRIFDELAGALGQHAGGMDSAKGDLAGVEAAHEKATANLQEQFASPFAESDIANTKNMTDAMNAIAPTVGQVAQFLASLTSGFSSLNTWLVKTAAQSPVLTGALGAMVEVIASLIAVASGIAAVGLGAWLIGAAGMALQAAAAIVSFTGATGAAATAVTALGVAVRVAAIATGIGMIVAVLATAAGVIYNFASAADRQRSALEELRQAHEEADAAMKRQIASVGTLQERHEALSKALEQQTEAQLALNEAAASFKSPAEIAALQKNLDDAKGNVRDVASKPAEGLAPTAEEQRRIESEVAANRALSEQAFQNEFSSATPARKAEMLRAKAADLKAKEEAARGGLDAASEVATGKAEKGNQTMEARALVSQIEKEREAIAKKAVAQTGLAGAARELAVGFEVPGVDPNPDYTQEQKDRDLARKDRDINDARARVASAEGKESSVGLEAPADSSVYAETMAQKLEAARQLQAGVKDEQEKARLTAIAGDYATSTLRPGEGLPQAISNWRMYAAQRRQDEGSVGQFAADGSQASAQAGEIEREQALAEARAGIEREIAGLKSQGAQKAEEEFALRQQILDKEIAAEQAKKSPDQARIAALQGEQTGAQRQRTDRLRDEEVQKSALDRQLAEAAGRRKGTQGGANEAVSLANLDTFAKHFEELRASGLYSDETSKAKALALTQGDIEDHAGSAVAASLQRVGGGGGTFDPMIDVQRQIKDLTQQSVGYLSTIAEKVAQRESPVNAPEIAELDD